MTSARALRLAEVAERLAISTRAIRRQVARGTFPIPELPSLDRIHRWSSVDVDRYLETAATNPRLHRLVSVDRAHERKAG